MLEIRLLWLILALLGIAAPGTATASLAEEPPAAAERDKLGVGRECPWGERANRVTRSNVRQQSNTASVSRLHVPD